ncbi:restriction endonuclease subunit S [Candidatus Poriferisodalis sp.]|uniref:restriction endonuclease subunit S n=1 Tax=Candidatus Poriferisodalis sp. TaxID=3101277 RepID=UPI003B593347
MAEWRDESLGSLVSLEYGSALRAESRIGNSFRVYGSNGVVGHHNRALVAGPGIIIGRKGSVGALRWSDGDFWPIDTTYWVNPKIDLDLRWMLEALKLSGLESLDSSTGVPGLNRGDAYERTVSVPPLEEQRRIAEILDTIGETIQATERVIAKLRRAHAALQQQVVPRWTNDGVDEALLGALIDPKRPIVYGILMPGEHVRGGVPVIKVRDIRDGEIASKQSLLHTDPLIDQQYARSRVRQGDILFTIRGTVGRTAIVPESHDGANITQDTARVSAIGVNCSYLVAAMATERFARFVGVHTIGQAVKGINLRELRLAPVPLVGRDEQEIAGAALDGSIASISAECERLEKLRLLRIGLADDLLSGRVRTVAT